MEERQDTSEKGAPPSRSRSASYSPLPPKSPPKESPSRSPVDSRRSRSRSRTLSRSRSPSIRSSRSPRRRRSHDRTDAYSVQVSGLTRLITESHLEHIFAFYGSISNIFLSVHRNSECKTRRRYHCIDSYIFIRLLQRARIEEKGGSCIDQVPVLKKRKSVWTEDRLMEQSSQSGKNICQKKIERENTEATIKTTQVETEEEE